MGKGELSIIIEPGGAQGDGYNTNKPDPNAENGLSGKTKPAKRKKLKSKMTTEDSISYIMALFKDKICYRLLVSSMLTLALICIIFLTVGLAQYLQDKDLVHSWKTKAPLRKTILVTENSHVNKGNKDKGNKDKGSSASASRKHLTTEKSSSEGKVSEESIPKKTAYPNMYESADHCNYIRHDDSCGNYSIYHDTKSRWSALQDHRYKRCFLFNMMPSEVKECPKAYPWSIDKDTGVLPRVLPKNAPESLKQFQAVYARVSRCVQRRPMDEAQMEATGKMIHEACANHTSLHVVTVLTYYKKVGRYTRDISRSIMPPALDERQQMWVTTMMDPEGRELKSFTV